MEALLPRKRKLRERGYSFIVRLTLRSRPVLNAVILNPDTGEMNATFEIILQWNMRRRQITA